MFVLTIRSKVNENKTHMLQASVSKCGSIIGEMAATRLMFLSAEDEEMVTKTEKWLVQFIDYIGRLHVFNLACQAEEGYLEAHLDDAQRMVDALVNMKPESEMLMEAARNAVRS